MDCHDRRRYPSFAVAPPSHGLAILVMAARRRLETAGVKIYDPADGRASLGLYCQHRSYYARVLND